LENRFTGVKPELDVLKIEQGVCCVSQEPAVRTTFSSNVTSVAWVAVHESDLLGLAATTDRVVHVLDNNGKTLSQLPSLPSPPLFLDVEPIQNEDIDGVDVLITCIGGEVLLAWLRFPAEGSELSLNIQQQWRDHRKQVTCGRFSLAAQEGRCRFFTTISRDCKSHVYTREGPSFIFAGSVESNAEFLSSCWVSDTTFVLASRGDYMLRYWTVNSGGAEKNLSQTLQVNLNATGDTIVSFAVLAMALSRDRKLLAICTDKSRIIVYETFGQTQLRNLYGSSCDEYDVPSLCFSHDRSFLYATSSVSAEAPRSDGGPFVAGQVAIFEVFSGQVVFQLRCHAKPVRCMALHPHMEAIMTGSFDKTVQYWT